MSVRKTKKSSRIVSPPNRGPACLLDSRFRGNEVFKACDALYRLKQKRGKGPGLSPAFAILDIFRGFRLQSGPGFFGQGRKCGLVEHGDIREDLSIELDFRFTKTIHKAAIGQPVLPRGGVDANDPKPTHLALALAAVAVGHRAGANHGLLGELVGALAPAAVTFGLLDGCPII